MISTSEIKISVVIDEKYMELAVRALHKAFELDQAPASAVGGSRRPARVEPLESRSDGDVTEWPKVLPC